MVYRSKLTVSLLNIFLILAKELMNLEVKSHLLHGFQNREASLSNDVVLINDDSTGRSEQSVDAQCACSMPRLV
jgi:hypothetical protein